jgi:hypothetical protein
MEISRLEDKWAEKGKRCIYYELTSIPRTIKNSLREMSMPLI